MEHPILVPEVCSPQGSLGENLASWLASLPWDYWWTITCKYPRRDEIAFIRDITESQCALGANKSFIACEPHRVSHNLHAHGLLRVERLADNGLPVTATECWDDFFHRFGRSRVESINSLRDCTAYCSKYVTKITDGDNWALWDLSQSSGRPGDGVEGDSYCARSPATNGYRNPLSTAFTADDLNAFDHLLRIRYQRKLL